MLELKMGSGTVFCGFSCVLASSARRHVDPRNDREDTSAGCERRRRGGRASSTSRLLWQNLSPLRKLVFHVLSQCFP